MPVKVWHLHFYEELAVLQFGELGSTEDAKISNPTVMDVVLLSLATGRAVGGRKWKCTGVGGYIV